MFERKLLPIYMLTIVNTFGFSLLLPILPYILQTYHVWAFWYGLILSVYSIFQFFAAPFFGYLSDFFGRRKVLLVTQFGTLLSWVVFSLALLVPQSYAMYGYPDALLLMLLARIFDGITWGNQVVANAYIADITKPTDRRAHYAAIGILTGVGLVIGPVIGGLTSLWSFGYYGTVITAIAISFAALIMIWAYLPETLDLSHISLSSMTIKSAWDQFDVFRSMKKLAENTYLLHLFVVIFFFGFVFAGFSTLYLWYAKDYLHATLFQTSLIGALVGIIFAANQFIVIKYLSRIDDTKLVFIGLICLMIWFGLFVNEPSVWWFFGLSYLITLGVTLCLPTFKAMVSKKAGPEAQWSALWVEESLHSLNRIIAPLLWWFFWAIVGPQVFGAFAFICLIPLVIAYTMMLSKET